MVNRLFFCLFKCLNQWINWEHIWQIKWWWKYLWCAAQKHLNIAIEMSTWLATVKFLVFFLLEFFGVCGSWGLSLVGSLSLIDKDFNSAVWWILREALFFIIVNLIQKLLKLLNWVKLRNDFPGVISLNNCVLWKIKAQIHACPSF